MDPISRDIGSGTEKSLSEQFFKIELIFSKTTARLAALCVDRPASGIHTQAKHTIEKMSHQSVCGHSMIRITKGRIDLIFLIHIFAVLHMF